MTAPAVMPNAAQLAASRKRELEAIVAEHGAITPEYVLARASDEASPLHALFEWDDSEAAQKFRLVQAAMYIRGQARMYRVEGSDEPMRVRAYISIPSDRGSGTFRPLARNWTVCSQRPMRRPRGSHPNAGEAWLGRRGTARIGEVWRGAAGKARLGTARRGQVRRGMTWQAGYGEAGRG
jgi:hypothetical protein